MSRLVPPFPAKNPTNWKDASDLLKKIQKSEAQKRAPQLMDRLDHIEKLLKDKK